MKPETLETVFLRAYEEHADAIFRYCYFRISDRELAKELMQEAFMRAWQYVVEGKAIDNTRALLYRIAHHLIIDHVRKKKSISLDLLLEEGFQPGKEEEQQIQTKIEFQRILSFIEKLPSKYRDILIMRYVDELSPKEIASIVHKSENVISVRINRGLKQLRTFLQDFDGEIL